MFTLQPPASCAPLRAFSVGNPKNAKPSRSTAIITRARVSDSPRIIVENDEETKKFRLRDHQREVIRDMGDFASGEVRTRDGDARSRWIFYFSSFFARSFFLRFGWNARADIRPRCRDVSSQRRRDKRDINFQSRSSRVARAWTIALSRFLPWRVRGRFSVDRIDADVTLPFIVLFETAHGPSQTHRQKLATARLSPRPGI